MSLPIPNPFGNVSTQKVHSSWINNLQANTYVAPYGMLFFDTYDGVLRLGDNTTPGGQIINTGGGGNGVPAAPNQSIQFNNSGVFGGNVSFTFDAANANVSLSGNLLVANVGHILQGSGIALNANSIDTSYSLAPGYNGLSAGPITIQDTAVIDVPDGQRWTIV